MRIGSEFQVDIPTLQNTNCELIVPINDDDVIPFHSIAGQSNGGTGSVLVWSPSNQLRDEDGKVHTHTHTHYYTVILAHAHTNINFCIDRYDY